MTIHGHKIIGYFDGILCSGTIHGRGKLLEHIMVRIWQFDIIILFIKIFFFNNIGLQKNLHLGTVFLNCSQSIVLVVWMYFDLTQTRHNTLLFHKNSTLVQCCSHRLVRFSLRTRVRLSSLWKAYPFALIQISVISGTFRSLCMPLSVIYDGVLTIFLHI